MSYILYKLDPEILNYLNITNIENKYYNSHEIVILLSKLKEKKNKNTVIISDQVVSMFRAYTIIRNNKINFNALINLIKRLSIQKKIPDCSYYTYDQIPNYLIK
jgi:hypothetical protein